MCYQCYVLSTLLPVGVFPQAQVAPCWTLIECKLNGLLSIFYMQFVCVICWSQILFNLPADSQRWTPLLHHWLAGLKELAAEAVLALHLRTESTLRDAVHVDINTMFTLQRGEKGGWLELLLCYNFFKLERQVTVKWKQLAGQKQLDYTANTNTTLCKRLQKYATLFLMTLWYVVDIITLCSSYAVTKTLDKHEWTNKWK